MAVVVTVPHACMMDGQLRIKIKVQKQRSEATTMQQKTRVNRKKKPNKTMFSQLETQGRHHYQTVMSVTRNNHDLPIQVYIGLQRVRMSPSVPKSDIVKHSSFIINTVFFC